MNKLKALLIVSSVITVLCWMVGCEKVETKKYDPSKNVIATNLYDPAYSVVVVENCEYIMYSRQVSNYYSGAWTSGITHKGNCKYCAERNLKPRVFSFCDSSVYEYRNIHDGSGGWTKVSHDATFIRDSAYRTQTLNINSNTGNIQIGPQN